MESKAMPTVEMLGRMFENNSDCYADTRMDEGGRLFEGEIIQAMTKEKFIKIAHEYAVLFAKYHVRECKEATKRKAELKYGKDGCLYTNPDSIEKAYSEDKIK